MPRLLRSFLFGTLILSACSAIPASPQTVPPATTQAPVPLPTTAVPNPKPIKTIGTPHIEQPPDGNLTPVPSDPGQCGYQWARQELPELSTSFQLSLQALQPEAVGDVSIFGENCVRPDGSIEQFLAKETDFHVTVQVNDLNNEADLGAWIVKVMQVITDIPAEQMPFPLPGRVFLVFQAPNDQRDINFDISQFQNLPSALTEAEIFQALQVPQ